uniref:Iodothyronine deiodinase n=1 Tax=Oncorhynchus kisutch TaxID=8019 RepID=A0A8C7M1F0_ONCKI
NGSQIPGWMILIWKWFIYLSMPCLFCFAFMQFVFLTLLNLISRSLTKKLILKMGEKVTMTQNPKFKYEDWGPTFMSWNFVKTILGHMWTNVGQEAFVGNNAPDSPVITLDGYNNVLSFFCLSDNRPLFKQLVKDFGDVADFLVVYIAEAHSTDGWVFANNVDITKHRNQEERLAAAQFLVKEDPLCPIVVDEMKDTTASKYGAIPERLYVLQAGKVVYKGKIGPRGYSPEEVRSFLEKMK